MKLTQSSAQVNSKLLVKSQGRIVKYQLLTAAILALMPYVSQAALITYKFTGGFNDSSLIFQAGDSFSGSYTFESSAPTVPGSDVTLDIQSAAISTTLPGTGWEINVISSNLSAPFSVSGKSGSIEIGNDNSFGDRYISTLFGAVALPLGLSLNFFQIDMLDPLSGGADMLSSGNVDVFPELSLANNAGGRFFITNPSSGCSQCAFQLTSLSASTNSVPEAGVLSLLAAGLLGLRFARRA